MRAPILRPVLSVLLASIVGCTDVRGWRTVESPSLAPVETGDVVRRLAEYDVVFLGEEHDLTAVHDLQLRVTRGLFELRPSLVVSMEMFERDVQASLDAYLAGELDEEEFRARSRPWPNYDEHYRPLIEWARSAGVPVVAANVPRPVARLVTTDGAEAALARDHAPGELHAGRGAYRARFERTMRAMGDGDREILDEALDRWFAAQCIKDEAMAESIVRAYEAAWPEAFVVHWCGKFHSDFRLGTVERLLRRRPDLRVAVVSTRSGTLDARLALPAEQRGVADFVWLVRR